MSVIIGHPVTGLVDLGVTPDVLADPRLGMLSLVTGFEMDPAARGRPIGNALAPQVSRVVVLRQR